MSLLHDILEKPPSPRNATSTPPLEPAPPSIFHPDESLELTDEQKDWLAIQEARGQPGLERAMADCIASYRSTGEKEHLHRAIAVLSHQVSLVNA